jgi:aspartate kinase
MHPVIVQKYGGSSVADVSRIRQVAERVAATRASGHRVVVVVSAMGDTTDELLALAGQVSERPPRRELDMLLTAGERISMALLSMALCELGVPAISFTGSQSGIITSDAHAGARIVEVRPFRIQDELETGKVVIVAGYQGVSYKKEITTLGRGGSDTTAVALAAALGATFCEICSDVDGVYSADPRVVDDPVHLPEITHEEMQVFAEAGAKVLHAAAVEYARQAGITLWARATASPPGDPGTPGAGTLIRVAGPDTPKRVAGVASRAVSLLVLPPADSAAAVREVVARLAGHGLEARWLTWPGPGTGWSAILPTDDLHDAAGLEAELAAAFPGARLEAPLFAVSIVGTGLDEDEGVLARVLDACQSVDAEPRHLERTSLRLTAVVDPVAAEPLTRLLHRTVVG